MDAELALRCACALGESPRWHAMERCLYWVDVPRGVLHRLDPLTGAHDECHREPSELGACAVEADGALLLFLARGAVKRWRDAVTTTLLEQLAGEEDTRWNDVVADARGRVVGGTMPTSARAGRLHVLGVDGVARAAQVRVRMPNGLAFAAEDRLLYVDSLRSSLFYAFYDVEAGEIGDSTAFVQVRRAQGVPDGIALDEAGGVWCALWGGGAVVRYAEDATETHRILVPARNVSAVAFAGEQLDQLMITTAASPGDELAGALFQARPPYRGRAPHLARLGSSM